MTTKTAPILRQAENRTRELHRGKGVMSPGAKSARESSPPPRLSAADALRAWGGKKK